MELILLLAIGFALHGAWDHVSASRSASRDQRMKEVAKSFPKGAVPKSRQKAAARQHAMGWWAREVRHGFPVTKTGWHAAWLAHQTTADHHKARREEARTTALETRASVLKGMPGHKQRQAEAQKELDAIEAELAAQQAKGSPATGKRAVREAADEVSRKRKEREQATGPRCPSCGAPEGYDHLPGCDPAAPPLPADSVPRDDLAEHLKAPMPDPRLSDAQRGRDQRGQRNLCAACGHPGNPDDELVISDGYRVHQSHTQDPASGFYEAPAPGAYETEAQALRDGFEYEDCENCGQGLDGHTISPDPLGHAHVSCKADEDEPGPDSATWSPSSPTTQGAPVSAETTYRQVLQYTDDLMAGTEVVAVQLGKDVPVAMQVAEDLQGAEADGATISAQMELADRLRTAEASLKAVQEQASVVKNAVLAHSGLAEAHQSAPVRAAKREFYED